MNNNKVQNLIILIFISFFCYEQLKAQNECNFQIEVGPDILLEVGETLELDGLVSIPLEEVDSINWSPSMGLNCQNCLTPIVIGTENICYTFSVTDITQCTLIDTICILVNPTNINQTEIHNVIQLFPNPVSQQLNIQSDILGLKKISIYNLDGELLFRIDSFDETIKIDISQFPNNIYYIKINTDQFNRVEKFVKQ